MGFYKLINIAKRDLRNSLRDNVIVFMLLMPIIMSLLLSMFFPETKSDMVSLVVSKDMDQGFISQAKKYANVDVVDSRRRVEERVEDFDDAVGIAVEKGEYVIITQGNEKQISRLLPAAVLEKIINPLEDMKVKTTLIGESILSVKKVASIFLLMVGIMIGGMVIGFNIVEDKSGKTLEALAVTPLTRLEFIAGRSILGIIINLVQTFVILAIVASEGLNVLHILIIIVSSLPITAIFGFYLGGTSNDQISVIANTKIGNLFFMMVPAVSLLIPPSKHFVLYPFPTFWIYKSFNEILRGISQVESILFYGLYTLLSSMILFLILLSVLRKA